MRPGYSSGTWPYGVRCRRRQVRTRCDTSRSSCRRTAPACTTTSATSSSMRQRVLRRVASSASPPSTWSTTATPCRSTTDRASRKSAAPATSCSPTPTSTIPCFDTAPSSSITFDERSLADFSRRLERPPQSNCPQSRPHWSAFRAAPARRPRPPSPTHS